MIATILNNIIWISKNMIYWLLCIFPVNKNIVVFESYLGQSFSGSPKYIYIKLKEEDINNKIKCVWTFTNPDEFSNNFNDEGVILVKDKSIKHYYYLARAKFWVRNSESMVVMKKRKATQYIQTWHGTPLKRMFYDDANLKNRNKIFLFKLKRAFENWTYFISPNEYTEEIFTKFFNHDVKILRLGYPRNDILANVSDEDKEKIKLKLGIKGNKKIILYTPTFRDYEYDKGMCSFKFKLDFDLINKELKDYIIIVRAHYYISELAKLEKYENVYNFSNPNYDIQELCTISDILITDYSSVMFDYAYTKNPILFYVYDYDKYQETRGNYFDLKENSPGPLLYSTSEIIDTINNIDSINKKYKIKYNSFYNKFCSYNIGDSSKNIANIILNG